MATLMEKDVLIETVSGIFSEIMNNQEALLELSKIRDELYSTSYKDIDYDQVICELKEITLKYAKEL